MKQKQIKIYSFGRACIADGVITSENPEDNIITLSESFLSIAFECYKNEKLEDGKLIEEFIKVLLPNSYVWHLIIAYSSTVNLPGFSRILFGIINFPIS